MVYNSKNKISHTQCIDDNLMLKPKRLTCQIIQI